MGKQRMGIKGFWSIVICFLLVSLTGIFPCAVNAKQTDNLVTVVDDAAVLMEEEADWLESVALELAEKKDWSVVVATCQDAEGKSAQMVCEENFNRYTARDDGISCLVDLDNREIYLATAGEAISYLDDDRIDEILDEAYQAVAKEDYAQCLYLMILRSGEAYDRGTPATGSAEKQDMSFVHLAATLTSLLILAAFILLLLKKAFQICVAGGRGPWRRTAYRRGMGNGSRIYVDRRRYFGRPPVSRDRRRMESRPPVSRGTQSRTTVNKGAGGRTFGGGGSRRKTTVNRGAGGRSFGGGGRKF